MKAFFLSRVLREKILLLALVLILALMWLFSVMGRAMAFKREYQNTTAVLQSQQRTLNDRARIQARATAAIRQLDPASTFDTVRLQSELDTMAAAAGITNKTIGDARTDRTPQFSVNSASINLRNVDYPSLVKFYEDLKKRSPYIGIDRLTLQVVAANVNQLTASITVSSVEVAK